jgi:glycosyltransferase involved in cell wall biosynthesis
MRILHCLRAPVGGLFRHVLDLAEEQATHGHDVGILAASTTEDRLTSAKFAAIAEKLRLGIARIPISRQPGLSDLAAVRAVRSHAATLDLDVLHGHGAKGGAYARLAALSLSARGRHVKSFYTPHGGSLNFKPGSLEQRFLLMIERGLESVTSGLIFESAYAARVYRSRVRSKGAPQRVIPNGLKRMDFTLADPRPDATEVLFVGELRKIKGVDILLDALADLKLGHPVTATIVGSGPDAERLKAMASALGLDGLVRFAGALPVREAFSLGRVMVVPSLAESFPYVVLEATAAGMPLIATNVGGIPEIVADTDTVLIEPGSATALASALSATLGDAGGAMSRAKRLRDKVASKFTVAAMTDAVLDFYAETSPQPARLPSWEMELQGHRP